MAETLRERIENFVWTAESDREGEGYAAALATIRRGRDAGRMLRDQLDHLEAARRALELLDDGNPGAAARIGAESGLIPGAVPVSEWTGAELPARVLWKADKPGRNFQETGAVIHAGGVGVLSGGGGVGKSTVTYALARAAALAEDTGKDAGEACGLAVRAGKTLFVSYEVQSEFMALGFERIGGAVDGVECIPDPDPLFEVSKDYPGTAGPSAFWDIVWSEAERFGPSLIVIDPAGSAIGGCNANDSTTVRTFFGKLTREAKRIGAGVLLVAHSTKAARKDATDRPGQVAGTAAWHDAPRGALVLRENVPEETIATPPAGGGILDKPLILECLKSNQGPQNWTVDIKVWRDGAGQFCGFRTANTGGPSP